MKKSNLTSVIYAVLHLKKKKPAEKVAYGNYLIEKISGNVNLPDPTPSLNEYQATVNNLASAITDAQSGSAIDKQALEGAVGAFNIDTRRLADYVQYTANANAPSIAKAIIYSAGMLTRKPREKTPVPVAVTKLSAIFTNIPGTILIKWKSVPNARLYMVYYSLSGDLAGTWILADSTPLRSLVVEGLTVGTRYYFKIVVLGFHGNSPASSIITCFAS